jgi:hypothetical protein
MLEVPGVEAVKASRLRAGGTRNRGFDFRRGEDFHFLPMRSGMLWRATRILLSGFLGLFRILKLNVHLRLVYRIKMYGAIPPLPHNALFDHEK